MYVEPPLPVHFLHRGVTETHVQVRCLMLLSNHPPQLAKHNILDESFNPPPPPALQKLNDTTSRWCLCTDRITQERAVAEDQGLGLYPQRSLKVLPRDHIVAYCVRTMIVSTGATEYNETIDGN